MPTVHRCSINAAAVTCCVVCLTSPHEQFSGVSYHLFCGIEGGASELWTCCVWKTVARLTLSTIDRTFFVCVGYIVIVSVAAPPAAVALYCTTDCLESRIISS